MTIGTSPAYVLDAVDAARPLGLKAFKLGTEEEGLGPDEVTWIAGWAPRDLGRMVKIGGPCARADLRMAGEVGATAVVAPMVESPFALWRFLEAADEDLGPAGGAIQRAFNLETGLALKHLEEMLDLPQAARLDFVNIGRSDLGASLGLKVGDLQLDEVVAGAIAQMQLRGIEVHVGGKVTWATIEPLLQRVAFPVFHTRFLAFDIGADPEKAIDAALGIEIALLGALAEQFPKRASDHRARATETVRRLRG